MPETLNNEIAADATQLVDDTALHLAFQKEVIKTVLKKSAVKVGVAAAAVTAAVIVVKKIRNGEDPLEEVV